MENTRQKVVMLMRLKFENIGIVSKGDVTIDAISVIAGNNNSGKSTIGKLLYGISTSLNMLQDNILLINKYKSISNELEGIRRWIKSEEFIERHRSYREDLSKLEIISEMDIESKVEQVGEIEERLDRNIVEMISIVKSIGDESNNTRLKMALNNLLERQQISADSEILKYELIKDVMASEFSGSLISKHHKCGDAKIELLEDNGDTIRLKYNNDLLDANKSDLQISRNYRETFYLDDPFLLDDSLYVGTGISFYNRKANTYKHRNTLLNQIQGIKKEKNYIDKHIQHKKIKEIFSEIIKGKIVTKNSGLKYQSEFLSEPISFDAISAGMKSFSILYMLVENGLLNNCEYLIFDEPETHLHPEWQLRLAELIVLISINYPVRVLITSHSPYFIEAIDIYSMKYKMKDDVRFYYSKMSKDEENMVEIVEVTDNLEVIYKDMYRPLSVLEELRDDYDEQ